MRELAQITGINQPGSLAGFRFGAGGANLIEDVISRFLLFAIVAAGLYFFVRLLGAGFSYLTSGGDSGKLQAASKSLINAAIGLFIVFTSFFLAQMIEVLFSISIL